MNGILLIDKPCDWTSHDVVAKLRGIYHERRIGHSGTLDPMATGLLVVFLGRATRAVEFAEADEKEYTAAFRLGVTTDTQDITGTVLCRRETLPSESKLFTVLDSFCGEIDQIPPMYSAIKRDGKKLYELARKGVEVERKARRITIRELEYLGQRDDGDLLIRVRCTKGTYIRTLCHDIGVALGCGACMTQLRRTSAGVFHIQSAHTLDEIQSMVDPSKALIPVDSLFSDKPELTLPEKFIRQVRNGCAVPMAALPDGEYRVYGTDGEFLMLGRGEGGLLKTIKSFFEV